jgi:hypothetical protein
MRCRRRVRRSRGCSSVCARIRAARGRVGFVRCADGSSHVGRDRSAAAVDRRATRGPRCRRSAVAAGRAARGAPSVLRVRRDRGVHGARARVWAACGGGAAAGRRGAGAVAGDAGCVRGRRAHVLGGPRAEPCGGADDGGCVARCGARADTARDRADGRWAEEGRSTGDAGCAGCEPSCRPVRGQRRDAGAAAGCAHRHCRRDRRAARS